MAESANVSGGNSDSYEADWSPDGGKIVFTSTRDGLGDLYVMDADGSNQARLTTTPAASTARNSHPVWSPDGARIAFINGIGHDPRIFTMNPDGTGIRAVLRAVAYQLDWQPTPGPDLVESALSSPPAQLAPGGTFAVSDTVSNQGTVAAGSSRTNYYLSQDDKKSPEDIAVGGRNVGGIAAGGSSVGGATAKVPPATALGTYRLIACADLQKTGAKFMVSDAVQNVSLVTIGQTGTRYYLSDNTIKSPGGVLLTGKRLVPTLTAGQVSTGGTGVTVPLGTAAGSYYLLACADDLGSLIESNEANNCVASAATITITP
jgi:dipeptidyl aminopeptidase/acylaminoacyl peptidase